MRFSEAIVPNLLATQSPSKMTSRQQPLEKKKEKSARLPAWIPSALFSPEGDELLGPFLP